MCANFAQFSKCKWCDDWKAGFVLQFRKPKFTLEMGWNGQSLSGRLMPRFCKPSDSKIIAACLQIRACKSTEHWAFLSLSLQSTTSNQQHTCYMGEGKKGKKWKKNATKGTEFLVVKKYFYIESFWRWKSGSKAQWTLACQQMIYHQMVTTTSSKTWSKVVDTTKA